jgi:hypothetical protein
LIPGMDPQKDRWIPISPPLKGVTPADWDIRNNRFDDVLVVTNPAEGSWQFRTYYYPNICITAAGAAASEELGAVTAANPDSASTDGIVEAAAVTGAPYAFFMNVSVQSTIQLEGRLLGLTAGQGSAGDVVNIVGTLLDKNGTLPAQAMLALIEMPNGSVLKIMKDDGLSGDGEAGDGIYGAPFSQTTYGGGYSVRILASLKDPANPANTLIREWTGGFFIKGPKVDQQCGGENDQDKDCMPDEWERRCKLDLQADDRRGDLDGDGLTNLEELSRGTLPCRADTDKGGENDGSEVRGGRDPLNPQDDKVRPLGKINLRALNSRILIDWTRPLSYTGMLVYVSTDANDAGKPIDMGQGNQPIPGTFLLEKLQNDVPYYVKLQGYVTEGGETAFGDFSETEVVMPKADPDMPSGAMLINNGASETASRKVVLNISATDKPLDGAAQGSAAHMTDQFSQQFNTVSGGVEMRVANDESMAGAAWQAVQPQLPWTLTCPAGQTCTVYAQFRDAAGNESLIVNDSIKLDAQAGGEDASNIFLPFASR